MGNHTEYTDKYTLENPAFFVEVYFALGSKENTEEDTDSSSIQSKWNTMEEVLHGGWKTTDVREFLTEKAHDLYSQGVFAEVIPSRFSQTARSEATKACKDKFGETSIGKYLLDIISTYENRYFGYSKYQVEGYFIKSGDKNMTRDDTMVVRIMFLAPSCFEPPASNDGSDKNSGDDSEKHGCQHFALADSGREEKEAFKLFRWLRNHRSTLQSPELSWEKFIYQDRFAHYDSLRNYSAFEIMTNKIARWHFDCRLFVVGYLFQKFLESGPDTNQEEEIWITTTDVDVNKLVRKSRTKLTEQPSRENIGSA